MWGTNGGVYFGYGTNTTEQKPETKFGDVLPYVGDRHLMTIGPNGSGKSRRVILPNLARLTGWSIVVVDPKADLCKMTHAYREKRGAKSIILNPFNVLDLPSHGFNPVAALDPKSDDFPDDAFGIAESMIRMEGRDTHWAASAQDLVAGLIMAVRLSMPETGSLAVVREFLGYDLERFSDNIRAMIAVGNNNDCPEISTKLSRYNDLTSDSREMISILSTALTQTRWLDSRPIQDDLSKGTKIDFSRLKEEPTSVYLTLPARRIGSHGTWMRVLIASIIQPLLRDTRKPKVPVLIILDEYPALAAGGFSIIEKNMAMFRGFGIKLWTVWQDLGQAINLYGKGFESFIANSGVLQSFAPQDVTTAEHLSKLMPLRTMSSEQRSSNFGHAGEGTKSPHGSNISDQAMPLMLPQHLRDMDEGFSVLFTHKAKGVVQSYFPYTPPGLEEIHKLDPS